MVSDAQTQCADFPSHSLLERLFSLSRVSRSARLQSMGLLFTRSLSDPVRPASPTPSALRRAGSTSPIVRGIHGRYAVQSENTYPSPHGFLVTSEANCSRS